MSEPEDFDAAGVSLSDLTVMHGGSIEDDGTRVEIERPTDDIPELVRGFLLPHERHVIAVRRHPVILLAPALAFAGGLAAAIAFNSWAYESGAATPTLVRVIWIAWFAAVIWAAWKWLQWRVTWFVATSSRLIYITGLLRRRVTPLPLTRLSDMRMHQALPGRRFGWGTLICESFATDHALHQVTYLPYIQWLFNEIWMMRLPMPAGRGAGTMPGEVS
jgi:hypothetical protein